MATTDISVSNEVDAALGWARRAFAFQGNKIVSDHPWAKTVELSSATSRAYLKIATPPAGGNSLGLIAEYLSPNVPPLMASDPERGLFLHADHMGEPVGRKPDTATKLSILTTYASVQRKALGHHDLIASLPQIHLDQIYDEFLQFLTPGGDDTPKLDSTVGIAHFLGRGSAQKYFDIFSSAEPLFRKFLARGAGLQPAINHCDLRPSNIARRKDGAIVILDWDDALAGPPGLSLHSLFRGCCRPLAALADILEAPKAEYRQSDRELLHAYVDQLCADGAYDAKVVLPALPAIICAGVLNYLLAFASYPVTESSSRETIGKNMRRRLSDLMDVVQLLARDDRATAQNLADAFRRAGRDSRAGKVMKAHRQNSDVKPAAEIRFSTRSSN
ncbi:MAG: phosphotransferase family protein [Rhizobiaceae bacterium]